MSSNRPRRGESRQELLDDAARLRVLHSAIHSTFALRSKSDSHWETWKNACATFQASYDALAFPGGLERAFRLLKEGDLSVAETAVLYCEIRPYYFRSGYNRTKFIRLLSRLPLPLDQATRLARLKEENHRRKMLRRGAMGEPK